MPPGGVIRSHTRESWLSGFNKRDEFASPFSPRLRPSRCTRPTRNGRSVRIEQDTAFLRPSFGVPETTATGSPLSRGGGGPEACAWGFDELSQTSGSFAARLVGHQARQRADAMSLTGKPAQV